MLRQWCRVCVRRLTNIASDVCDNRQAIDSTGQKYHWVNRRNLQLIAQNDSG